MTTPSPDSDQARVVFTCKAPEATAVRLAGTFNDWNAEVTSLSYEGAGEWTVWLMLASGRYKYRFVVDGVWRHDPRAAANEPNPYGGLDSLIVVKSEARADFL